MELIATRNKLMPFIDNGFVHLSRRKKPRNKDRDLLTGFLTPESLFKPAEEIDPSLQLVIREHRNKIK